MLLIVTYILYNTLILKSKWVFWISAICALKFKIKGQSQMKLTISRAITSSFLKDTKWFFSSNIKSYQINFSIKVRLTLPSVFMSLLPHLLIFPCSNLVPKIPEITKHLEVHLEVTLLVHLFDCGLWPGSAAAILMLFSDRAS